jgi:hypothetical protein
LQTKSISKNENEKPEADPSTNPTKGAEGPANKNKLNRFMAASNNHKTVVIPNLNKGGGLLYNKNRKLPS